MLVVWGAQKTSALSPVWVQKASRNKWHNKSLKVVTVKWAVEIRLLPEDTKWYTTNWERGKAIEEGKSKKTMLLIDMPYPNEYNKIAKRDEKIGKYHRLCFELRERQ